MIDEDIDQSISMISFIVRYYISTDFNPDNHYSDTSSRTHAFTLSIAPTHSIRYPII